MVHVDTLPDDFARALKAADARVAPLLQRVVFVPEIGSTNDEAAKLAARGAADWTLVLADAQTAGRGRMGRSWFSPPGAGLYISIVMRPSMASPLLTLAGGVALAEGLRASTGLPVELKWPNDLMAPGGRLKLGGILAEGSSAAGAVQFVIFGFGINLRGSCPPEFAGRATTLEGELGRPVDRGSVLVECLAALAVRRRDLEEGRAGEICRRWLEFAPSALGRPVEWTAHGRCRRGAAAGIDEHGALLVRVGSSLERVISGEVRWL